MDIEVWHCSQALANRLCFGFRSEMSSPYTTILIGCHCTEAVVTLVDRWSIVWRSSNHHWCIIAVLSNESCFKFTACNTSVSVSIVPCDPQLDFIISWIKSNCTESISKISGSDPATSSCVENFEGITEIEIWLVCETCLFTLNFIFNLDHFFKTLDKFIFFTNMKQGSTSWGWRVTKFSRWFSDWGCTNWRWASHWWRWAEWARRSQWRWRTRRHSCGRQRSCRAAATSVWQTIAKELCKFCVVNSCVSVSVDSSYDTE